MKRDPLSEKIARQLRDQAGVDVAVELLNGMILLSGTVDSFAARELAEEFVASLAPGHKIENHLVVDQPAPLSEVGSEEEDLSGVEPLPDIEERMDADLGERLVERAALSFDESGEAVMPPIDPVMERGAVVGGFGLSSMDSEIQASSEDQLPGDEALAETIRRELREDASTSGLDITVDVQNRIARLSGTVAGPEDADNAEAVASRVPGVIEIVEELEFTGQ